MALSLEELRHQREQIQQHLNWLDAHIAQLDHSTPVDAQHRNWAKLHWNLQTKEAAQTSPLAIEPAATTHTLNTSASSLSGRARCLRSSTSPDTPTAPEASDIADRYEPHAQHTLFRAKMGCLALFVLSTVLFLFLLFGLPYLL